MCAAGAAERFSLPGLARSLTERTVCHAHFPRPCSAYVKHADIYAAPWTLSTSSISQPTPPRHFPRPPPQWSAPPSSSVTVTSRRAGRAPPAPPRASWVP